MKTTLAIVTLIFSLSGFSQTLNGILPPTFKSKVPECQTIISMPTIDNATELKKADQLQLETQNKVLLFGKEVQTSIDFMTKSFPFVLPNGKTIRQLKIKSKGALSLNFIFSEFELAPGALLFITSDEDKFVGAYTSLNNNLERVLGTELVHSDEVTLVLEEEATFAGASTLKIGTVVHGYRDIDVLAKGLNTSGDCNVDVNCPAGIGWEKQRNSVAMIVSGGGLCTGSLVHNTTGNTMPYFLTAKHCGPNAASWVYRFRWESPPNQTVCAGTTNSGNGPTNMTVNGGTIKASNGTSDFQLILLNNAPDSTWGIYYNGWDNSDDNSAINGTGIHHPDGDIKKISKENNVLDQETITFQSAQNRTWRVGDWDLGVTEPGSSGSPLFDQNKRVIGVLSGGGAACSGITDNNQSDYYGRFGYAWDNGPTANEQLKEWLDPANTGFTFIDGYDPLVGNDSLDGSISTITSLPSTLCNGTIQPSFRLENLGTQNLTNVLIEYGLDGNYSQTLNWTGNLSIFSYENLNVTLPIPLGTHTFNVRIASVNNFDDQDSSNNHLSTSFNRLLNDFSAKLHLELDCYGSETSWLIKSTNNDTLYIGGPYTDDQPDTITETFCLQYGCYNFVLKDSYGDGLSGGCTAAKGGDGLFHLTNLSNNTILAQLTEQNAGFGSVYSQNFCVNAPNIGLSEIGHQPQSIRIYPNPGTDQLNIKSEAAKILTLQLMSLDGKMIHDLKVNNDSFQLDASNFARGVYLIKVETEPGISTHRWTKK